MFESCQKKLKKELRKYSRELPSVSANDLTEHFLALRQVKQATTTMVYVGMGYESDTIPLIKRLLSEGKRVVLPRCLPERQMEVREIKSISDLSQGMFKIPEPGLHCPVIGKESIEVVLVPYVLCDSSGYRLGHGGGYYDRWLSDFEGTTVLICSRERMVERLPREPHDKAVDVVIAV